MAADHNSHISPLAPPQIYRRSDDKWGVEIYQKPNLLHHNLPQAKRRKTSKCFVYIFTLTVLLCLAVLVFATVVLRSGHPKLRLEAVRLSSGEATAEMKLSNGNFGRFRYRTGTVSVVYGNTTLGKAEIRNGIVFGRKSARIKAVVKMNNSSFASEVGSAENLVKMKWFAELRGEVRVVKIMSSFRTSFMNCSLSLNLSSKAVQDLWCY